jgi:hypothetical protein
VIFRVRERRRTPRVAPGSAGWREDALLRPGLAVRVVDIGPLGALLESSRRFRPGVRTELHLRASHVDRRLIVSGRVARCHVVDLDPVRYRGAMEFDRMVELMKLEFG